jgi:hypothetical protein
MLALEGLALELTATVARQRHAGNREPRLDAVRDMLVRELSSPPSLSEVARSDEGLASVAARAGFADQSHLTREFKRRYGVTPGRYRRAHR